MSVRHVVRRGPGQVSLVVGAPLRGGGRRRVPISCLKPRRAAARGWRKLVSPTCGIRPPPSTLAIPRAWHGHRARWGSAEGREVGRSPSAAAPPRHEGGMDGEAGGARERFRGGGAEGFQGPMCREPCGSLGSPILHADIPAVINGETKRIETGIVSVSFHLLPTCCLCRISIVSP